MGSGCEGALPDRAGIAALSAAPIPDNDQITGKAMVIPFGRWAGAAVLYAAERGFVDPARVLTGLLHPSGANAHRPALFAQNAPSMQRQRSRWFRQIGET